MLGCNKLLDIGCDYGDQTVKYAWYADEIIAIDPNKDAIARAKQSYGDIKNISFRVCKAEHLPFRNSEFDCITMTDTLEHVDDDAKTIAEAYRVLQPDGRLILSVPHKGMFGFIDAFNLKYNFPKLYKWWKGKSYNPDIYKLAPPHRHYSMAELQSLFKGKFEIEEMHYGGLLLWPLLWILHDAVYVKWRPPKPIFAIHQALARLDYSINYGPSSYHVILRLKSTKGGDKW